MPITKAIVKKDFLPFFKIGDKVSIVPILYKEDTLLVKEIQGVFKDGKLIRFFSLAVFFDKKAGETVEKVYDAVYAPKGSYKDSYIELEDGTQYPSRLVRNYQNYFTKVASVNI